MWPSRTARCFKSGDASSIMARDRLGIAYIAGYSKKASSLSSNLHYYVLYV